MVREQYGERLELAVLALGMLAGGYAALFAVHMLAAPIGAYVGAVGAGGLLEVLA